MNTREEQIPTTRGDSLVRLLGVTGLTCSPAFLIAWLLGGFDNPAPPRSVVVAQFLFLVGWLCSVLGLLRVSAAGRGHGRYLLWVQLGGVALASTQELQDLFLAAPDRGGILYRAADAAWPLSVLFMIVAGIAVARAGVLKSWRRFAPIVCGASLPVAVISAGLAGRTAMGPAFGVTTTIAWGAMSWALINTARPRPQDRDRERIARPSPEPETQHLASP